MCNYKNEVTTAYQKVAVILPKSSCLKLVFGPAKTQTSFNEVGDIGPYSKVPAMRILSFDLFVVPMADYDFL